MENIDAKIKAAHSIVPHWLAVACLFQIYSVNDIHKRS